MVWSQRRPLGGSNGRGDAWHNAAVDNEECEQRKANEPVHNA